MSTIHGQGQPTSAAPGSTHDDRRRCGVCSQDAPATAAYCPWCGSATPLAPADGLRADDAPTIIGAPTTAPAGRRRRTVLIATGIVAGVAAVAASALWLLLPSSAERQLEASAQDLSESLTDLADARTPADVRASGAAAAGAAAAAERFISQSEDVPTELREVSEALSAIAGLAEVSGEAPEPWQSADQELSDLAVLAMPAVPESLVAEASGNAETIIAEASAAFQTWVAEHAAATAARESAIAEASTYRDRMQSLIDDYADLRNGLSDYIEVVDTEGSTMEEAYYQFGEAASGRREVRDRMQALDAPDAAAGAHGRLIGVITDGVAGIESALRGLDEATCFFGSCYVEDEPAYQTFRSESKRITVALDDAIAQWQSAADRAIADAEAMPLPAKPEV